MKREETVDYLANIYAVVAADGEIDRVEERVFESIAREIGSGYFERKQAIARLAEQNLPVALELRWSDQIRNLEDMLFVAYCDGTLDPTHVETVAATHEGDGRYVATFTPSLAGPWGASVRVMPTHPALSSVYETGLVTLA